MPFDEHKICNRIIENKSSGFCVNRYNYLKTFFIITVCSYINSSIIGSRFKWLLFFIDINNQK